MNKMNKEKRYSIRSLGLRFLRRGSRGQGLLIRRGCPGGSDADTFSVRADMTGGTPEPEDGRGDAGGTVRAPFAADDGDTADLTGMEAVFERRGELVEQIRALRSEMDGLDDQIKRGLGERSAGACGRWSVSWKLQKTGGLDRDAIRADYPGIDFAGYAMHKRVFRVSEKK